MPQHISQKIARREFMRFLLEETLFAPVVAEDAKTLHDLSFFLRS